jgi:hypothetical protein
MNKPVFWGPDLSINSVYYQLYVECTVKPAIEQITVYSIKGSLIFPSMNSAYNFNLYIKDNWGHMFRFPWVPFIYRSDCTLCTLTLYSRFPDWQMWHLSTIKEYCSTAGLGTFHTDSRASVNVVVIIEDSAATVECRTSIIALFLYFKSPHGPRVARPVNLCSYQ